MNPCIRVAYNSGCTNALDRNDDRVAWCDMSFSVETDVSDGEVEDRLSYARLGDGERCLFNVKLVAVFEYYQCRTIGSGSILCSSESDVRAAIDRNGRESKSKPIGSSIVLDLYALHILDCNRNFYTVQSRSSVMEGAGDLHVRSRLSTLVYADGPVYRDVALRLGNCEERVARVFGVVFSYGECNGIACYGCSQEVCRIIVESHRPFDLGYRNGYIRASCEVKMEILDVEVECRESEPVLNDGELCSLNQNVIAVFNGNDGGTGCRVRVICGCQHDRL